MFGTFDHADGVTLTRGEMQGDVAAVVNVSAMESRRLDHGGENSFGDGASHRGHRCDVATMTISRNSLGHSPGDGASRHWRGLTDGTAQKRQLLAEFIENSNESRGGRF